MYLQCGRFDKGVLSSIRNKLKKERFTGFEALLNGLQHLDKVGVQITHLNVAVCLYAYCYSPSS